MKHAIIAIEDRRFYTNEGYDLRGIGRALWQDVVSQRVGAGRLDDHPAVRQELARGAGRPHAVREAARGRAGLPPHAQVVQGADPAQLPQHDLLRQRRLRGRVRRPHLLRRRPTGCESDKTRRAPPSSSPHEAALLAGVVASPSGYDPIAHPKAARNRRDLVLERMLEQGFINAAPVRGGARRADPDARRHLTRRGGHASTRTSPRGSSSRSSTSSAAARGRAARLRGRPDRPDDARLRAPGGGRERDRATGCPTTDGPRASLVAIDNSTGEVRAMVGGDDYRRRRSTSPPRASASPARRSSRSCSPRRCAGHLARLGVGVAEEGRSRPQGGEKFDGQQLQGRATSGVITLANATTISDNSVYAEVASRSAPEGRADGAAAWASARRSRTTTRSRSAASSRASRRSTWPTRTRRSPAAASSSTAR